ncbi:TetR/AcrR family transcriptional regulator [Alcanivorax jadensis]|uniref:TetR/AcrR family transcriptional regulator n=1 Tax=Alcanivorax jadensis TaxID=64988 RepID=UPI0026F0DDC9|nr:TetR/AcrR family transcriptional regulator [Alcanivorax jadensis]
MRYSASHKAEIRQKLITAAGALCKEQGFGVTGVDALMATVSLSGGAFYGHFKTKGDLLEAIIDNELTTTRERFINATEPGSKPDARTLVRGYLSRAHLDHPSAGCALPSLSNEVARADDKVKQTFETQLLGIHGLLSDSLADPQRAWSILAMVVGAISLARAMHSPEQQQQLLDACIDQALATID